MQTVSFRNSEARGRNGWFRMASASLYAARGRINVDVVSKRAVCPGPVCLELSPEEALAQAMLNHAQAVLHPPAAVRVLVRAGVADWYAAGMRILSRAATVKGQLPSVLAGKGGYSAAGRLGWAALIRTGRAHPGRNVFPQDPPATTERAVYCGQQVEPGVRRRLALLTQPRQLS